MLLTKEEAKKVAERCSLTPDEEEEINRAMIAIEAGSTAVELLFPYRPDKAAIAVRLLRERGYRAYQRVSNNRCVSVWSDDNER